MPTLSSLLETKVFVSGATFLVLAYKRDVQSAAFLLGAVSNALLSKILKRLINASRPQGAQLSDPGMPSSHAQSLFFFAGYLFLLGFSTFCFYSFLTSSFGSPEFEFLLI